MNLALHYVPLGLYQNEMNSSLKMLNYKGFSKPG